MKEKSFKLSGPKGYVPISNTDKADANATAKVTPFPDFPSEETTDRKSILEVACFVLIVLLTLCSGFYAIFCNHDRAIKHGFSVETMKGSLVNTSPDEMAAAWNITFNVTNRGGSSALYYEKAKISVLYNGNLLWTTSSENFYVEKGDHKSIKATIDSTTTIANEFVQNAVLRRQRLNLPLYFDVWINGMVREYPGRLRDNKYQITVYCPVKVEFQSSIGTAAGLSGQMRNCIVWA